MDLDEQILWRAKRMAKDMINNNEYIKSLLEKYLAVPSFLEKASYKAKKLNITI